ncbi:hypothetical protein ACRPK8_07020 [Exiguobacterium sp. TDN 0502]|uniref:hypothetical protein n=1 Tax=Exiguobacterium sp. TDN 0502 TaxID=3420731 RepID=UPI003D775B6D
MIAFLVKVFSSALVIGLVTEVTAVLAMMESTNQASIRVLEKAGLIQVGSDDHFIMWERMKSV